MKAATAETILQDEVTRVFTSRLTTISERACVVFKWMEGDFDFYTRLGIEYGVDPIVLLIASILDIEDSILSPNGKPCKQTLGEIAELLMEAEIIHRLNPSLPMPEIVKTQLLGLGSGSKVSYKPVDKPAETVDNSAFSVDNPVGKIGDKSASYPQVSRHSKKDVKLSTPCGKVRHLSTELSTGRKKRFIVRVPSIFKDTGADEIGELSPLSTAPTNTTNE